MSESSFVQRMISSLNWCTGRGTRKENEIGLLKGKVIMKLNHAKRKNRSGLVELSKLSGHPNYVSCLKDWAAVNRHADDKVHVFSYRHQGGIFAPTDGLGDRYLSANYEWALNHLDEMMNKNGDDNDDNDGYGGIGWIDILCTCHDEETLMDAFGYMGELYLYNKVSNNYMTSPTAFAEVQARGWIYQESAFPSIDVRGWNDEAWCDMSHYRTVADLILRRGFQGHVKKKALDLKSCKAEMDEIIKHGSRNKTNHEWWCSVDKCIEMICDPEGLGIVLDLHGLNKLALEANEANVSVTIGMKLQQFAQKHYKNVVRELKSSLTVQATPSLLGYFAVGSIKAFLSSKLSRETDRHAAVFGVLKALSNYQPREGEEEDGILKFVWKLAYPKGEIIASAVRTTNYRLAGLGAVDAIQGNSIAPHIPHLSTFVPELNEEDGAKLYAGTCRIDEKMEFSVEILADKTKNVRAIRIVPKTYWNYKEILARVPKIGITHHFE